MTERQRQQRAAFLREHPGLCVFLLNAAAFVGCAAATDVLRLAGREPLSRLAGYLLPLVIALPVWLGMWGWARRTMQ
jgi:hypothetical protein